MIKHDWSTVRVCNVHPPCGATGLWCEFPYPPGHGKIFHQTSLLAIHNLHRRLRMHTQEDVLEGVRERRHTTTNHPFGFQLRTLNLCTMKAKRSVRRGFLQLAVLYSLSMRRVTVCQRCAALHLYWLHLVKLLQLKQLLNCLSPRRGKLLSSGRYEEASVNLHKTR